MCNPMAATIGLGVMGQLAGDSAENDREDETRDAAIEVERGALEALALQYQQLALQGQQQDAVTTEGVVASQIKAAKLASTAATTAGENGVEGISVQNLLNDYKRQLAQNTTMANVNSKAREQQRIQERMGLRSNAKNRINLAYQGITSGADPYATALSIGGTVLEAGVRYDGWGQGTGEQIQTNSAGGHYGD